MITEADIKKMADIIVDKFHPEKIILFGSYARGKTSEDSDVDLIVITQTDGDLRELAAEMQLAVWDIPVAKDILVRTPEQFEEEAATYWTVFSEALKHGKVLFDRAA